MFHFKLTEPWTLGTCPVGLGEDPKSVPAVISHQPRSNVKYLKAKPPPNFLAAFEIPNISFTLVHISIAPLTPTQMLGKARAYVT